MTDDALIVFTPSGKRRRFERGTTVLDAARALGVDLESVCGGRALCGRCQVEVQDGAFAKHGIRSAGDHITPATLAEGRYGQRKPIKPGRRLACQACLADDVVIDVPDDSQVHRQVVRKRAEVRDIELYPVVRLHYVEVEPPALETPTGDLERLRRALLEQWGLDELRADLRTIQGLQKALRDGDYKVTVALHDAHRLIAVWPGFQDQAHGIAIDVGSTTVAAHLCDLQTGAVLASGGIMNPQIRFGEDLMSRVSYVMMNPGGDEEMTRAVRVALRALIAQVVAEAAVEPEHVLELTLVGNPIMHHLLLGIDPTELGGAPFALATSDALKLWARELDLDEGVHPDARVYVLPCIAGHVGADTAAVILSETPHLRDEVTLIVDIGTNAELVLGNQDRLLAASSPTGPAFEGAQILAGQRAAPGAIERVRIDRATLEPRFKVIGCELWSDEPGFSEAALRTGITGICGSGIIEALGEMYLAGLIRSDGTIDGAMAARSPRIEGEGRTFSYRLHDGPPEIRITQGDVRAIQLAKAALRAGAELLMERLGVHEVTRITLAGAFGSHIDPLYALVLGMIPDCPLEQVSSAGNAAGTGARIALLNGRARREIERVVRGIEKVETAVEPNFQAHFVAAMAFPHGTAPSPHLAARVALPAASDGAAAPSRNRRRRLDPVSGERPDR